MSKTKMRRVNVLKSDITGTYVRARVIQWSRITVVIFRDGE